MAETIPVTDVNAFLDKWKFVEVGGLADVGGCLSFTHVSQTVLKRSTYVIVAVPAADSEEPTEVWYVGSAFYGWKKRHRQHNGGLNRRTDRATEYLNHLKGGGTFSVYERAAGRYSAFGDETWAQEAEEAILIALLKPKHNRQKLERLVSQNPG